MVSVIEEIYLGGQGAVEKIQETQDYRDITDKAIELSEKLDCLITQEQQVLFHEIIDTFVKQSAELALNHFKEGVKLGIILAAEAFT